jgi:hypothetical protein
MTLQESEVKLVEDALKEALADAGESMQIVNPKLQGGVIFNKDGVEHGCRVRLDFELDGQEQTKEVVRTVAYELAKNDLLELVEYGDIDNHSDPLLNIVDGSRKRNKIMKDFNIRSVYLYKEWIEKKNSVEYTMYFNFRPIW